MKKLTFVILVFCCSLSFQAKAQISDTSVYWMYAELLGTQKFLSVKVTVEVDLGQSAFDKTIVDPATGRYKSFNSMVDAMNFIMSG